MEPTNSKKNIINEKIFSVEATGALLLFGKNPHLTAIVYDNRHCQRTSLKLFTSVLMLQKRRFRCENYSSICLGIVYQ